MDLYTDNEIKEMAKQLEENEATDRRFRLGVILVLFFIMVVAVVIEKCDITFTTDATNPILEYYVPKGPIFYP